MAPKLVITQWPMLAQKLAEHKLSGTWCDTCRNHFQKDHAVTMLSQKYAIRLN